jgi:hypothetical protein
MKKITILYLLLFVTVSLINAQIKVNSTGSAGFGIDPNNGYQLYAKKSTSNIYNCSILGQAYNTDGYGDYTIGVYGYAIPNGYKNVGLIGYSYQSTLHDGRTYGVMGYAGNGIAGYNFGVYGQLNGQRNGAAIYGNTNIGDPSPAIDRLYAGYFSGYVLISNRVWINNRVDIGWRLICRWH